MAGDVCSGLTQGARLGSPPPRVGATAASPQFSVKLWPCPGGRTYTEWQPPSGLGAAFSPKVWLLIIPSSLLGRVFCPTGAGQEPEGQFLCFAETGAWAYPTPNPSGNAAQAKSTQWKPKETTWLMEGEEWETKYKTKHPSAEYNKKAHPLLLLFPCEADPPRRPNNP